MQPDLVIQRTLQDVLCGTKLVRRIGRLNTNFPIVTVVWISRSASSSGIGRLNTNFPIGTRLGARVVHSALGRLTITNWKLGLHRRIMHFPATARTEVNGRKTNMAEF